MKNFFNTALIAFAFLCSIGTETRAAENIFADVVIRNANVITVNSNRPSAEAI
jgi:hypothetical protein